MGFKRWLGLCVAVFSVAHPAVRAGDYDDALRFRDLFYGSLDRSYTADQRSELIYLPGQALIDSSDLNPANFLAQIAARLKGVDPFQFYEKGRNNPAHPEDPSRIRDLLLSVGNGSLERLTIVIVPGVFGEFIKTRAFEEVFSQEKSAFRDVWRAKLKAYQGDPAVLSDARYSTLDLREVDTPIQALFHVSSIDDSDGKPLVNVVLFDVSLLSLESMGSNSERAAAFNRRLTRFFKIVGLPENIALLGYSRGTPLALSMLSQAAQSSAENPWLAKVKALVGLGGVIYGSDLADDAVNAKGLNPPPAAAQQLQLLGALKDQLQEWGDASFLKSAEIFHQNNVAYAKLVFGLIQAGAQTSGAPASGDPAPSLLDLAAVKQKAQELIEQYKVFESMDLKKVISTVLDIAAGSFRLDQPRVQYDENIRRIKTLITEATQAVRELSTQARLDWWKNNTIPEGVHYYAISASMVDGALSKEHAQLAGNTATYNPQLQDYLSLTASYQSFVQTSGIQVNDSQVAAYKVRFWPLIHPLLNPAQKPFRATYLGLLGVDHWGLALRVVNEARPGAIAYPYSPFPRVALLKAVAAKVVEDLAEGK